ncbi:MAG: hypothetical protein GY854_29660 [Deltaproteobacteria bacterium]|nr:hypothetical protein [Deltaproteobacteria bacterium]
MKSRVGTDRFIYSVVVVVLAFLTIFGQSISALAGETADRELYGKLTKQARGVGEISLFTRLNEVGQSLDWSNAKSAGFEGHLRLIRNKNTKNNLDINKNVYLVREVKGELFVLALPRDLSLTEKNAGSPYAGLLEMVAKKMVFEVETVEKEVDGEVYKFARLKAKPDRLLFDIVFAIACSIMLFSVMIGMGFSLTPGDFKTVFKRPKGMVVGTLIQFGLMPLIAFGLGHLFGYVETFPYVFMGMILVTSTPGGATSNLMTHLAKGDVALSISLTATASFLCLILTPALLTLYCTSIEGVEMPVKTVVLTIFGAVLLPLIIGMIVRNRFDSFARRAVPFFSAVGLIAVITIMVGGVFGNLNLFKQSAEDFGFMGWIMVFSLTSAGMIVGVIVPKVFGIGNFQTRAISMEIGIRNVVLGMTIATLIQDYLGDYSSHMFIVSAGFAFAMYLSGALAILIYRKILPTRIKASDGIMEEEIF